MVRVVVAEPGGDHLLAVGLAGEARVVEPDDVVIQGEIGPAVAEGDPGGQVEPVHVGGGLVEDAVAVAVAEGLNPVVGAPPVLPLDHVQAAVGAPGHGHGVDDHRLDGGQLQAEPGGHAVSGQSGIVPGAGQGRDQQEDRDEAGHRGELHGTAAVAGRAPPTMPGAAAVGKRGAGGTRRGMCGRLTLPSRVSYNPRAIASRPTEAGCRATASLHGASRTCC